MPSARPRSYNPAWGELISEYSSGRNGGGNGHAYERNRPLNLIDPIGLCDQSAFQKALRTLENNPGVMLLALVID